MISRSTLIGALVVAELAIVGLATEAIAGGGISRPAGLLAPPQLGFGSGAWGAGSGASDGLHRSFVAGLAPRVVIDVHDVDVVLQADSGAAVRVDETLHRSGFVSGEVVPLTAQQSLDVVKVSSSGPSPKRFVLGIFRHELRITVPSLARVEFASAGDIDVSGLRTKLLAHLPDGAIKVRDHRGDVDVSTGSGRITMVDVQGSDIAANTRDGRIYLTRVGADRINGTSSSGRIVGVDVRAVDGTLTTREGRVVLSFTGNSDAIVSAHAGDGRVRVSGFTITESDDQRSVIRLGSGRGHFEVSTADGPITITPGASV
jgi:hypothetical protein